MKKNYLLILFCCFSIIKSTPAVAAPAPPPTNNAVYTINNISLFIPAKVFSFDVTERDGKDLLQWAASVNNDLYQFQIESSTDNIHFLLVDSVYPKEVSSTAASYEFYSPYLITGTRYYRLKLVYTNGYTEYSPVVSIDDATDNKVVVFYSSAKQFKLVTPYILHSVNVLNASGQVLLRLIDVPAGSQIINMSNFQAGIYWIQCLGFKNEVFKIQNG